MPSALDVTDQWPCRWRSAWTLSRHKITAASDRRRSNTSRPFALLDRLADPRHCRGFWYKNVRPPEGSRCHNRRRRWRSTLKWQRQSGLATFISRHCGSYEALCSWCCTEHRLCHHRIAAGLLQLSVLQHVKHQFAKVTESAEFCCTNCLPSFTTPTSLSRAS